MNTEPKFKIGDKLRWRYGGGQYDCLIIDVIPAGYYAVKWYNPQTNVLFDEAPKMLSFNYIHKLYIDPDSPAGIWARI